MSEAENNKLWLLYSGAIATLMGGFHPTPNTRWYTAPLSYQVIPSGQSISQFYQNWNIYELGDLASSNQPILGTTGNRFSGAYQDYLNWVDLSQAEEDPYAKAKFDQAQAQARELAASYRAENRLALTDYRKDYPGGMDPFTGEMYSYALYCDEFYPYLTGMYQAMKESADKALALSSQISGPLGDQLADAMDALQPALVTESLKPGYNFPCIIADPRGQTDIIYGESPPGTTPAVHLPAFSISGTFNGDAQKWINSFPTDYKMNPASYRANAKARLRIRFEDHSSSTWQNFGFSQSTRTSGGWWWWSYRDVATGKTITKNLNITETDIYGAFDMYIWNYNTYSLSPGLWWKGNLNNYPIKPSAPASIRSNVEWRLNQVMMGYGIEIEFKFTKSCYNYVLEEMNEMKRRNGRLGIFGSIFGNGGSSSEESNNTHTLESIQTNSVDYTFTLKADPNSLPVVLAAAAVRNFS